MDNTPAYQTKRLRYKTKKTLYLFESKGHKSIIKAIEYTPISKINNRLVYNLGFGDYDEYNGKILDNSNSNNGDMRKVFSTVLNTIPDFFKKTINAAIWIQGSDSAEDYKKTCKKHCKKNCTSICKNYGRRIRIYRYYLDKKFVELSEEYKFYGVINNDTPYLEKYNPKNQYLGILVINKK